MIKYIFYFFALLSIISCSRPTNDVERALKKAGKNRTELEKVLDHYSQQLEDSLKYKAACFLIENMPGHYYFIGKELDSFYALADSLFSLEEVPPRMPAEEYGQFVKPFFEKNNPNPSRSALITDIKSITASFLISHIDKAFYAWETYPWGKNISFHDFCEYILPYRLKNELPEDWRGLYHNELSYLVDSLIAAGVTDELGIFEFLSPYLIPPYNTPYYNGFRIDFPASLALKLKVGTCQEFAFLSIFTSRAFAIPVTYDFTPQWGNRSLGHNWNLLLATDPPLPFTFGDRVPIGEHLIDKSTDKLTKVYRVMYSIQKETLIMQNKGEEIPPLFKNPYIKDVSAEYFEPVNIQVKLTEKTSVKKKFAYIMAFNDQQWVPVHWGKIKNGEVTFTDMAKDCAYMVMYYHMNMFFPAAPPFYVDVMGQIKILTPDVTQTRSVLLKRKFHELYVQEYAKDMVGGKFQAADNIDFIDAKDLYTIDSIPEVIFHTIELDDVGKYKYFRYVAADHSEGNIAGIELYDSEGKKLTGEIIGTADSLVFRDGYEIVNSIKVKSHVFDGQVLTYFRTIKPHKAWVGLVFKEEESIRKIKYIPRNDDNFIRDKEIYELFYWDKGWKSLGQQEGSETTQYLIYDNVPENALLLLKNLTIGIEERIFTYENDKQVWW